jgi:hypothetical protein
LGTGSRDQLSKTCATQLVILNMDKADVGDANKSKDRSLIRVLMIQLLVALTRSKASITSRRNDKHSSQLGWCQFSQRRSR